MSLVCTKYIQQTSEVKMIDYDYVIKSLESQDSCNKHFLDRYIKTVNRWEKYQHEIPKSQYPQRHHVVPRWMGGVDNEVNCLNVPVRVHLYLHKLLYQMTRQKAALCSIVIFSRFRDITEFKQSAKVVASVDCYLSSVDTETYSNIQRSLTKNSIWMNKDGKDSRIKPEKVPYYVSCGWDFGRSNAKISGWLMVYDLYQSKWKKIRNEEYHQDKNRYKMGMSRCWDASNQPNFPYVTVTAAMKSDVQLKEELRSISELIRLSDGSYIHNEYFDPVTMDKWQKKLVTPGGNAKSIYHTPYGNFCNIWEFERRTSIPHCAAENYCKRQDKIISPNSKIYDKDKPKQTHRQAGWFLTPIEEADDDLLDTVIGLERE